MAARLHRAALTLLCAVAVIYGTALFPAAFDVELQAEGPAASAPATSAPATDAPTATATESTPASASGESDTPTRTPEPTPEPTPPPTRSGGAGGDGDAFDWLSLVGYLVVIGGSVLTVGGIARAVGRSDRTRLGGSLPALSLPRIPFVGSVRRIPQITTALLITAGSGLAQVVDGVAAVTRTLAAEFGRAAGPVSRIAGGALFAAPAAALGAVALPFRALTSAGSLASALPSLGSLWGRGPDDAPDADARDRAPVEPAGGDDDEPDPIPSVAAAWAAMTELVPVRNHETTTPAEYARAAIDHGLPEEPVRRLTRLFRGVRYGDRRESPDRLSVARRALAALRGGED